LKSSLDALQKQIKREKNRFFWRSQFGIVLQLFNVKLTDGLAGI
jgi:hypothetical protein